jgi:hypothetical protein
MFWLALIALFAIVLALLALTRRKVVKDFKDMSPPRGRGKASPSMERKRREAEEKIDPIDTPPSL